MPPAFNLSQDQTLEFNLAASSLLKVRLAPRGARLASNAGESPHSSAISIVQEPLPSTWREGRRNGDEDWIIHASNLASSPESNSFPTLETNDPKLVFPLTARPAGRRVDRESGIILSERKKARGFQKKTRSLFLYAIFLPLPPGGGRHCAIAGKPLLPSCSLSSRFSFIKLSRANKRSGHGAAF